MQRIVFDFDEASYEALLNYADKGKYNSLGNALRDILQIGIGLQNQEQQGFSEVIVRNPKTNDERVLHTPKLGTLRVEIL